MAKTHVGPVYLEPIEHVYIHRDTGKKYVSVTKIIGMIEEHFDTEGVAKSIEAQSDDKKQKKYIGMSKDQIIEAWQTINDEANEYGTKVHEIVETYLLKKKWWFPEDEFEKAVIKAYEDLKVDEGREMFAERIMFAEDYELAGTADLVIDIDDTYFDIGDWKTNKEFNYFNKFGFKTLLKPFEHLQDCQYSVYTLQLSTYALMYELETGRKCRQIWIGWWDKKALTFTKIPIMYLKNEARKLLELHKYQTQLNS
jgi:hypothetical protein